MHKSADKKELTFRVLDEADVRHKRAAQGDSVLKESGVLVRYKFPLQ